MYPALAVARALHDARPELELSYVGGVRGFERRIVGDELPYDQLVVRSLRSAGRDLHLVLDPLRLGASVPQAWALLGRLRPSAVFSSGGYLGIPLVLAARGRGIPALVWEGNVIPGRATRALTAFCAWLMTESEHVALRVGTDNDDALRLYERVGFRTVDEFCSSLGKDAP